jgi:hypothetical protein
MKLTAQKKVSEMEEKIENLEKTISSNNSIHEDNELKRQLVAAKDQFEKFDVVLKMLDVQRIQNNDL